MSGPPWDVDYRSLLHVLLVSLVSVTSLMLHIHTFSTCNQRLYLSSWQPREIKHLSLPVHKRNKTCAVNESKEAPSVKNFTNWRRKRLGQALYDWRIIRDRNRNILSSTASRLALHPEDLLHKRNQGNFPRVSSDMRVNLYICYPHSPSCLDTQLGRGQLHLSLYRHTSHQYAPSPPSTGKQIPWLSEPTWIRVLTTGPLPVLCCVPSFSKIEDEILGRARSHVTCVRKSCVCLRRSSESQCDKGFLMGRHLIAMHSTNPVNVHVCLHLLNRPRGHLFHHRM